MRRQLVLACVASVIGIAALSAAGADGNWAQFRGPQAGLVADDPQLPDSWSTTENVVWKADVAGSGWSSPVVWGDHVFVTAAVNTAPVEAPKPGLYSGTIITNPSGTYRWVVYDFDFKTGRLRWEREVRQSVPLLPNT